jgi:uncharacterized protein Yka (UPF0111/DUF47 family)
MNSVEMTSRPFVFVEHLWEYAKQVNQVVERTPLLLDAFFAADTKAIRGLCEQVVGIRNEADLTKHTLYGQFKSIRFRPGGEYAVGHYIDYLDAVIESVDEFTSQFVLAGVVVPEGLRSDLRALVGEMVLTSGALAKLADILWPSEDTLAVPRKAEDASGAIEEVIEGYRQTMSRKAEFVRHLYATASQLDPAAFQCLYHCGRAAAGAAKGMESAANHLRAVVGYGGPHL